MEVPTPVTTTQDAHELPPVDRARSPLLPALGLVYVVLGVVLGGAWLIGEARSSLFPTGWILPAVLVAIVVPGVIYLASIPFGAGAFGIGDVKLLVGVGLMSGGIRAITGIVSGLFLAGVVLGILLVTRRITLKSYVPYGPFLIFGAVWGIFVRG